MNNQGGTRNDDTNNDEPPLSPSSDGWFASLQQDLSEVERGLSQVVTPYTTSMDGVASAATASSAAVLGSGAASTPHNTPASRNGSNPGWAIYDSVGSALGSIRSRLQTMARGGGGDGSNGGSGNSGNSGSNGGRNQGNRVGRRSTQYSNNDGCGGGGGVVGSIHDLQERLQTAERAYNARIPLPILRNELSRRETSGSPEITGSAADAATSTNPAEGVARGTTNDDDGGGSEHLRRQRSTPVASRRYAESQRQIDMELHGGTSSTATKASSKKKSEDPSQAATKERDDSDTGGDDPEVGVLLDAATYQKLETSQNHLSLLHPPSPNEETIEVVASDGPEADPDVIMKGLEAQKPSTSIYSWGVDDGHNTAKTYSYNLHCGTDATEAYAGTAKVPKTPKLVAADTRLARSVIYSVSMSENHVACATATGSVLVSGDNSDGAVDPSQQQQQKRGRNNNNNDKKLIVRPARLESLAMTRILQVSCGSDHTAAITDSRSVLTWGNDQDGQLGHRQRPNATTKLSDRRFRPPTAMALQGKRAASVACGNRFTVVLSTRMEALVCGREEITGYSTIHGTPPLPSQIPALIGLPLVCVAAGHQHAVVVTAHGTAYAWGTNTDGCCGREFPNSFTVPVPINVAPSTLTTTASSTSLVPKNSRNTHNGKRLPAWVTCEVKGPMTLGDDRAVVHATCGRSHTIMVTKSGQLLVAGSNGYGQLGVTGSQPSNCGVQVVRHPTAGLKFTTAAAGDYHTLVLDSHGDVWQMGGYGDDDDQRRNRNSMDLVLSGRNIGMIAAGGSQNVAIVSRDEPKKHKGLNSSPVVLEGLLDGVLAEIQRGDATSSSAKELAQKTEELFRCPAVMNSLFVDPKDINNLYNKLGAAALDFRVQQQVATAIEKGMTKGLESLQTARLMYPESVRCLLLYLQCPLFRQETELPVVFDERGELIQSLCEAILGLPFEGYKVLLAWATSVYGKALFAPFLVKPLVVQLNKSFAKKNTDAVPVIVDVLKWFQSAAERSDVPIAHPDDFHSSGIDELGMEALFDDLRRFKRAGKSERSSNFFICANSFLLAPGTKRNLLQVENQIKMVQAAQSAGVTFDAARREFLFQPYFVLAVDRQYILQQTLQAVASASSGDLRKSLKIIFKGEDGVDAGGVKKEFFQLLVAHLFDINTGMWSFGDANTTWFNSDCTWNDDGYYLVGVLVGLAVYNNVLLDVHFPTAVYRKLLGLPLGLEDMVDESTRNGLQSLLDYKGDDVEDIFCLNFEVSWMDLGLERRRELKPGGSSIPVTSSNKEEYVMLYVKWLLVDSVKSQYTQFERGFMRVMENSSLDILQPDELELLVVGTPILDFDALRNNAVYDGGYTKDSDVVQNLWKFLSSSSDGDIRIKFLKFVTGCAKAPIGGLGELPFKIQRAGPNSMQLPTSHTCFNTLLLPDYGNDYEKLSNRLGRAIMECEGFGLQ